MDQNTERKIQAGWPFPSLSFASSLIFKAYVEDSLTLTGVTNFSYLHFKSFSVIRLECTRIKLYYLIILLFADCSQQSIHLCLFVFNSWIHSHNPQRITWLCQHLLHIQALHTLSQHFKPDSGWELLRFDELRLMQPSAPKDELYGYKASVQTADPWCPAAVHRLPLPLAFDNTLVHVCSVINFSASFKPYCPCCSWQA